MKNGDGDMKEFDYLIVGAGLYGAVFAQEAQEVGKKCLVIDKRDKVSGNIATEESHGINVHSYGAHIFHTSNKTVWDFVNAFAEFNRYTNCPIANYKGELYSLPFNMYTFNKMWGVVTPEEAAGQELPSGQHWTVLTEEAFAHQSQEKKEANSPFAQLQGLFDQE